MGDFILKQDLLRDGIYYVLSGELSIKKKIQLIAKSQQKLEGDSDEYDDPDKDWKNFLNEKKFYKNSEILRIFADELLGENIQEGRSHYSVQCQSSNCRLLFFPQKLVEDLALKSPKFKETMRQLELQRADLIENIRAQLQEKIQGPQHRYLAPTLRSPKIGVNPMLKLQRQLEGIFQEDKRLNSFG